MNCYRLHNIQKEQASIFFFFVFVSKLNTFYIIIEFIAYEITMSAMPAVNCSVFDGKCSS